MVQGEGATVVVQAILSAAAVAAVVSIAARAASGTVAAIVAVLGTWLHGAPSCHKQSICQWFSCTCPGGASSTLGTMGTPRSLHHADRRRTEFAVETFGLTFPWHLECHFIISPLPLLLQTPLILCSVLLTLVTSLCGALGRVVQVMGMLALQCPHHCLH